MRLTSPTLVLTLSFLPLSACTRATSAPHVNLASSTEALQEAFNRDSGKVRAIFLASPTCGECIHGASELERVWLDKDSSRNIAVYVVWSRQLGAEEKHVADAMTLVPDARARHYWDGEELVGKAFQPVLDLLHPPGTPGCCSNRTTTWRGDRAPTPAWWEHQLSVGPPERQLDPERFASHAEALKSVLGDHT